MDLELADYQRSMQSLEARLSEHASELDDARLQLRVKEEAVETLRSEVKAMEQQHKQEEEKATKIKALLKKTRKDQEESHKQVSVGGTVGVRIKLTFVDKRCPFKRNRPFYGNKTNMCFLTEW